MRLKFEHFDGRRLGHRSVIEESTGKAIGHIRSNGVGFSGGGTNGEGGIDIYLFGGRYQRTVNTYDQCWGFVKGVEAVLSQMTSDRDVVFRDTLSDVA